MKKYFITLLILSAFALQACDKEDNEPAVQTVGLISEITIPPVEIRNLDISEVVFMARVNVPSILSDYEASPERYMLRVPYNKDGFSFRLPENPPQVLFRNIKKDLPVGLDISDESANTISFVEIGCFTADSDRMWGKLIYHQQIKDKFYTLHYMYCDRPVKITGSGTDWWEKTAMYDLNLKKGWNMVVEKSENTDGGRSLITVNNLLPDGMDWIYSAIR